jgi:hypothetical protein
MGQFSFHTGWVVEPSPPFGKSVSSCGLFGFLLDSLVVLINKLLLFSQLRERERCHFESPDIPTNQEKSNEPKEKKKKRGERLEKTNPPISLDLRCRRTQKKLCNPHSSSSSVAINCTHQKVWITCVHRFQKN